MNEYIERTITSVFRCNGRPSETRDPETGEYVRLKCESTITATASTVREGNAVMKASMNEKGWSAITTLGKRHTLCKGCVAYAAGKTITAAKAAAKKVAAAKVIEAAAKKVAVAKIAKAAAKKVAAAKVTAAVKVEQTTFLWGKHRVKRTILTPMDDN